LIYRASQDGFESKSFHAKCDDKPNTLVMIKSTNGNVFGGFTGESWGVFSIFSSDSFGIGFGFDSFIYSLVNKMNKPIKIEWSKNKKIDSNPNYGPTFGSGHDFYIADKSNTNTSSSSNLGSSYIHPDYAYGSNEARSFLAGSYNFQVSDIEVYTKQ